MSLENRLLLNPEIADVQRLTYATIEELLTKRYGTAVFTLKVHGARIVSLRRSIEQNIDLLKDK